MELYDNKMETYNATSYMPTKIFSAPQNMHAYCSVGRQGFHYQKTYGQSTTRVRQ